MLFAGHDNPTIRHAIIKKLDAERGVEINDIQIHTHKDCVRVGILAILDGMDSLIVDSRFELPLQFELRHLHNELDQIAEQYKAARRDFWANGRTMAGSIERRLHGTGLRGLWRHDG
jgi:hypothetical protein